MLQLLVVHRLEDMTDRVNVWINDVQVVENGGRHPEYIEEAGQAAMNPVDIDIRISMGVGSGCHATCDLTKEENGINAEYRT